MLSETEAFPNTGAGFQNRYDERYFGIRHGIIMLPFGVFSEYQAKLIKGDW